MPGMKKTMEEFKSGKPHSGSKKGKKVMNRKQAIAIGLNANQDSDVPEPLGGEDMPTPKPGKGKPLSGKALAKGFWDRG